MRLWHKDLIKVLPRNQLLGQWQECCMIARAIAQNDSPNHILVNPIMDYPIQHFIDYASLVRNEMVHRGYSCNWEKFSEWLSGVPYQISISKESYMSMFSDWHNGRYYDQCYYNLQEKYDRGGITLAEWMKIEKLRSPKG